MRQLLLAFALFAPAPAQADPACLAAPTQDCVFQMALDQALDQPKAGAMATGIMITAVLQETAGNSDWSATLDLLWPSINAAEPDPAKARQDLGFSLWAISMTGEIVGNPPFAKALQSTARLNAIAVELSLSDPEKTSLRPVYFLGRARDIAAIKDQIALAAPRKMAEVARIAALGLIDSGHIDDAFGLLHLVPSRTLSRDISRMAINAVLRANGPDDALALAQRFADKGDRKEALVEIALEMAKVGRLSEALSIVNDPLVKSGGFGDFFYVEHLAETLARAGESDRALQLLDFPDAPFGTPLHLEEVQVIAAAVASDFARMFSVLERAKPYDHDKLLELAVQARWHATGPSGIDGLLILLPAKDMPVALIALGRAQVAATDLPAALSTEARLAALPGTAADLENLRQTIAPLMAKKGQIVEAVAMANTLGHPWTTALIAAEISN